MSIIEELLAPLSLEEFKRDYFAREPLAFPGKAVRFRRLIGWELLFEIFATGHPDCWLPKNGRLPEDPAWATGKLTPELAQMGYAMGRTVLVRHSERAHPKLKSIAADFESVFQAPTDIQLYVTPAQEEGFDWHYDVEDVFVIQSAGEKEFRLRRNKTMPPPLEHVLPKTLAELENECVGPELRCLLKPGDFLYIPAGCWHKARALTPSFHLSVGVLTRGASDHIRVSESDRPQA